MKSKIIVYLMFSLCIHPCMQGSGQQKEQIKKLTMQYGNAGPLSIFTKTCIRKLMTDKEKKELMHAQDPVCQSCTSYLTVETQPKEWAPKTRGEITVETHPEAQAHLTVSPSKEGLAQPTTSYTTELAVPGTGENQFLDIQPKSSTTMRILLYDLNDRNKPARVVFDNTTTNK